MLQISLTDTAGTRILEVNRFPVAIGKGADCDVQLTGWRVARVHAQVHLLDKGLRLIDSGSLNGTWVNGERIVEFGPLLESDEISIGAYTLRLALKSGAQAELAQAVNPSGEPSRAAALAQSDSYRAGFPLRRSIHRKLLQTIDLRRTDVRQLSAPQLRREVRQTLESLLNEEGDLPKDFDRERFLEDSLDEALGLGPLEALLADSTVSEIMVNSASDIYVERSGKLQAHPAAFTGEDALRQVIERIVAPLGRRIDESSPMVDARLPDGSRVNAVIPPIALRGPALTIRKFNKTPMTPEQLLELGSVNQHMLEFLQMCVTERKNIVVSGGTGSGKTTLLNALSNLIPVGERIVTIEDAAELRLHHQHLISLESRPVNLEGKGSITIRDLVRNSLRMRPDRIVVGECRGGEALDMLQAMNTGHDGSLTTIHANSPRDALARLEVLVLMAGMDLPLVAVREQIASAVDVLVQQTRSADGKRRISSITEVSGMESGRIQLQEIFRWDAGQFKACGMVPAIVQEVAQRGVPVDFTRYQKEAA